ASRTIRERPWLEPRSCPIRNCSSTPTSAPSRPSAYAAAAPMTPAPTTTTFILTGSRLGVDDHVGDLGSLAPDPLFDLACAGMRVGERGFRIETEREEGDEAFVRVEEAQIARLAAGHVADDPQDGVRIGRDLVAGRAPSRGLF